MRRFELLCAFTLCGALVGVCADRIAQVESGLRGPVQIKGAPRPAWTLADRMRHHKVRGVSIAVLRGGKIEWARGYGVKELGKPDPVTPETKFQAASISKPFGAMAALYLVQAGKLSLDEDVNRKLVSWKVPENEFTRDTKVTLRYLLTHSAGMTVSGFPGYAAGTPVPTLVQFLDGAKPANTAPIRVDTVPGTAWRYSGGGFSVMQQLVGDASGKPFPEFLREVVLGPSGMRNSTFEQPLPESLAPTAAVGHLRNGEPVKGKWHTYPEMAAAGLWTTPSDLLRFSIELQQSWAGKSYRVLNRDMTRRMLTRQLDFHWGRVEQTLDGRPGLGIALEGEGDAALFSHGGANQGFRSFFVGFLETGDGAAVMTNSDFGMPLVMEITRSIAAAYEWPNFKPVEKTVVPVGADILARYVGRYKLPDKRFVEVTVEGGKLFVQPPALAGEKYEYHPQSPTSFFSLESWLQSITFVEGGMMWGSKTRAEREQAAPIAGRIGRPVRVVSLGFRNKPFDLIRDTVDREAAKGTDIVILPETWRGQKDGTAELLDGPTVTAMAALARKHRTYIVCPIDRMEGGRRLNSAVLVDRQGKVVSVYNKVFPYWEEFDLKPPVAVGKDVAVYQADFGKIGFAICFDINFPEVWSRLAEQGVELAIWSSAYSGGGLLQAHALNHHYYIVGSTGARDCQAYDITGAKIMDEKSREVTVARLTLDLDRGIYHEDFNIRKRDKLLKERAADVFQEQALDREEWFVLKARRPGVSARELASQYGLEELRDYVIRSRREIDRMRGQALSTKAPGK